MSKVLEIEVPKEAKNLAQLVRTADKENPKVEAERELSAYFAEHPHVADALGNLVHLAQNNLLSHSFGTRSIQLAVIAKLDQMRDGMGFAQAGTVERSRIEHVCLCWLRLYDCELRYHMVTTDNPTFTRGKYWEAKLSAHQRRYLRAVETLERVRKLMRPDSPTTAILMQQNVHSS